MTEQSKDQQKRSSCVWLLIALALAVACIGGFLAFKIGSDKPAGDSSITTIELKDGTLEVPGPAYIDGRDLEAQPQLTIMSINVWEGASPRGSVACQLPHGQWVKVSKAQYAQSEGQHRLRVGTADCHGWVSKSFVSVEYYKPVGDRIE